MAVSPKPGARVVEAVGILLLLCLLSAARFVVVPDRGDLLLGRPISVSQYERRFDGLRKSLPASGVVGYLGDENSYGLPNYFLAQYALAPLIVDHSPDHALVVGNFVSSSLSSVRNRPPDLIVVQDFGDGVCLLEKRAK